MQRQPGDGLIVWYDLMSTDPAATEAFYGNLFGWTLSAEPEEANGYRRWQLNGEHFGGVLPWDASMSPSNWMAYHPVSDLHESVNRTEDLASCPRGTHRHPQGWAVCGGRDPTGAPFYLFDLLPE